MFTIEEAVTLVMGLKSLEENYGESHAALGRKLVAWPGVRVALLHSSSRLGERAAEERGF